MRTKLGPLFLCVVCLACGGKQKAADAPAAETSSGGEGALQRAHAPIPMPQPAVPRDKLRPELQALWERVEKAVGVRPPEPPKEGGNEALQRWVENDFRQWLERRRQAVREVEGDTSWLSNAKADDQGVAAALWGYLYEDTASAIRGAPVPADLAADAELLQIYEKALNEALDPFARRAARAYKACITAFGADEKQPWHDWARYCDERGEEVVRVYRLDQPAPDKTSQP